MSAAASWALAPFQDRSQPAAKSRGTAAQHSTTSTACLPYWPLSFVPNGQQHLDLCSWFPSSTISACQCSSIALPLFTFTSFIVYYSLRSFIHCAAVCPRRLHHESSRQPFANLVFLPQPLPPDLSPSATQAHSLPPSLHPSIHRDCETYTIVLITSIHDDRTRGGAAVHVAVGENSCVESAGCGKELERTTTTTTTTNHWQKTSSTSPRAQESTSASISRPDDEQPPNIYIWLFSVAADGQSSPWCQ